MLDAGELREGQRRGCIEGSYWEEQDYTSVGRAVVAVLVQGQGMTKSPSKVEEASMLCVSSYNKFSFHDCLHLSEKWTTCSGLWFWTICSRFYNKSAPSRIFIIAREPEEELLGTLEWDTEAGMPSVPWPATRGSSLLHSPY